MRVENESATANGRNSMLITAFVTLQMFGWIGSSIVLLTFVLSRKIQRHVTWVNLCVTWILSGLSYSLLLFGHQLKGPPHYPLCLTQAALIYASPPLTAGATSALAMHLLFSVRSSHYSAPETTQSHRIPSVILVTLPYLTCIAVFIWVLVMGMRYPDTVIRVDSGMYCGMSVRAPGKFSAAFVAVTMAATVLIEGFIISVLYRNWRAYQHNNRGLLAMIIRVLCFTVFSVLAVGISFIYLSYPSRGSVANIILATHPVAFALIFGTQKDLFCTWMFWRQDPQHNRPPPKPLAIRLPSDTYRDSIGKKSLQPPGLV